jgi:hypothetical protein
MTNLARSAFKHKVVISDSADLDKSLPNDIWSCAPVNFSTSPPTFRICLTI